MPARPPVPLLVAPTKQNGVNSSTGNRDAGSVINADMPTAVMSSGRLLLIMIQMLSELGPR